jgi:hypothetical protein
MNFRAEILRGVRMAAILFAVFLVALAVYRMGRSTPAEVKLEPPAPTAAPAPAPSPASAPAASFTTPAAALSPSLGSDYPPPPPLRLSAPAQIHRVAGKRLSVETVAQPVVTKEISTDADTDGRTANTTAEEQRSYTADTKRDASEIASGPNQNREPDSAGTPDSAGKPERRGKRWVRAVGRLLHIGTKKDVPVEPERQP